MIRNNQKLAILLMTGLCFLSLPAAAQPGYSGASPAGQQIQPYNSSEPTPQNYGGAQGTIPGVMPNVRPGNVPGFSGYSGGDGVVVPSTNTGVASPTNLNVASPASPYAPVQGQDQGLTVTQPYPPTQPYAPTMPQEQQQLAPALQEAPVQQQAAQPVAPPDACAAYMASFDAYTMCQDRIQKIQRMKDAQEKRTPKPAAAPVAAPAATTAAPAGTTTAAPAATGEATTAQQPPATTTKSPITKKHGFGIK